MSFPIAFLAMLVDRFVPMPSGLTTRFGHPVIWQGKLIDMIENNLNSENKSPSARRNAGILMLVTLIAATLVISLALVWVTRLMPFSWAFEALLASVFLAHRGLEGAVHRVAMALDNSIESARLEVSHIVGRDVRQLDAHEISRAAIESLAENSSDGIIAPLFWLAIFGLPGIAIYKAINTADSMVGHKNRRYLDFGWASAKLDDVVNWIPARLSAIFYALAARYDVDKAVTRSWGTAKRDAPKHLSPNAGWPEAAMAGALNFGLGGPRAYGGEQINLAHMGDGKRDLTALDIKRALKLFSTMTAIALILTGLLALIGLYQLSF